jgi:oligosaccharide repeat unit polymerase
MDNLYLILYGLTWLTLSAWYYKKAGKVTPIVFVFAVYTFFSVMSYLLYNDPEKIYPFKELDFFPFLYLFVMLMIASSSIRKYSSFNITGIQQPDISKLNIFTCIFIISALLSLPTVISNINKIPILLFKTSMGQDAYNESIEASQTNTVGLITNLPAIITGLYSKIGPFLLFYYLTLKKRNKWIIIGLIYAIFSWILSYAITGQRGGMFHTTIGLICSYVLLKDFLPKKIKARTKKIGIIALLLITIPTIALTVSRFGEDSHSGSNVKSSLYYYLGQSSLYFNNYGLDDNGIRYGDRTCSYFKILIGFNDVPTDFWSGRKKYPNLHIGDEVFSSFVGDFTIDFGPIFAFIIFVIIYSIFYSNIKVKKSIIPFHTVMIVFILLDLCVDGAMFLYPYGYTGNLKIFFYILGVLYFKFRIKN